MKILSRWAECIKHNVFLWRRLGESGSETSCFLITEGAEAEECLKIALENNFFPFLFGIMVSSRIPCLNKSFSVIDFEPSFYSSSTYNYPSVSKGEPCHPRLWQRPKWSDMMNGKNTAWTWYCGVFESIVLNLADTMLSVIVLMKALFMKWRQILFLWCQYEGLVIFILQVNLL